MRATLHPAVFSTFATIGLRPPRFAAVRFPVDRGARVFDGRTPVVQYPHHVFESRAVRADRGRALGLGVVWLVALAVALRRCRPQAAACARLAVGLPPSAARPRVPRAWGFNYTGRSSKTNCRSIRGVTPDAARAPPLQPCRASTPMTRRMRPGADGRVARGRVAAPRATPASRRQRSRATQAHAARLVF